MSEDTGPAPCPWPNLCLLGSGSFHKEGMLGVGKQCSPTLSLSGPRFLTRTAGWSGYGPPKALMRITCT